MYMQPRFNPEPVNVNEENMLVRSHERAQELAENNNEKELERLLGLLRNITGDTFYIKSFVEKEQFMSESKRERAKRLLEKLRMMHSELDSFPHQVLYSEAVLAFLEGLL